MGKIYRYILANSPDVTASGTKLLVLIMLAWAIFSAYMFESLYWLWQSNKTFNGLKLVPIMAAVLFFKNRDAALSIKAAGKITTLTATVTLGLVVAVLNYHGFVRSAGYVFIAALIYIFISSLGIKSYKFWLGPLLFLSLMIPPSQAMIATAEKFLQYISASIVEPILPWISDETAIRDGISFIFPGKSIIFTIAGECSGVRSLIGMIVISSFICVMDRQNITKSVSIISAGILTALILNLFRIILTIKFQITGFEQLCQDKWHGLFGIVCFVIGLLIIKKLSQILSKQEILNQ